MHLTEIIAARGIPSAGLIIEVSRRCPLSCAHCSTSSTLHGRDLENADATHLIASFTPSDRPSIVSLTGGEPLLRPDLVEAIATGCHSVGTRVHLLTGLYFARKDRIPARILSALGSVDHVAASLDVFHEREVARDQAFCAIDVFLGIGKNVSLQIVGYDENDPYLDALVADVRSRFGDQVPMLVSAVKAIGRGQQLGRLKRRAGAGSDRLFQPTQPINPCAMVAWPVLCSDGRITACCNQKVVDGLEIAHLTLGHASTSTWPEIRRKMSGDPVLRCLRAVGPEFLAERLGTEMGDGYCQTCHRLSDHDDISSATPTIMSSSLLDLIEALAPRPPGDTAVATEFADKYGLSRFADLTNLGR